MRPTVIVIVHGPYLLAIPNHAPQLNLIAFGAENGYIHAISCGLVASGIIFEV